ncbi:hypothetical protein [Thalassotalea ganghwensis]
MNQFTWNVKSAGLLAIVVLLCVEYIAFPWFDWVNETQASIVSAQEKLEKQERLIAKAKVLEEQREALTTGFSRQIKDYVIVRKNEDSAVVWLQELDTHLAKYDFTVNNKSPLREVELNSDFAVFVGKVNIRGNYGQVLHFLDKLENESVGNRVRQLRLTRNPATKESVVADIEFLKVLKRS